MGCFALTVTEVRYTPCLLFTQWEGELLVVFQFFPAAQWSETLQCSSSLELLLVFSWSYCVHALPREILNLRVLVSCLKLEFQFCVVWRACPIHLSLEVFEVRCLRLNSPLLLEDVINSHKWGGNHLWVAQGKNLVLQSCFLSPQCHQSLTLG